MLTVQPEPFLKDIDGRIDIAVVFRPAYGAGPVPYAHVLQLRDTWQIWLEGNHLLTLMNTFPRSCSLYSRNRRNIP